MFGEWSLFSEMNECLQLDTCPHYCTNTKGSFKCTCDRNYKDFNGNCIAKGSCWALNTVSCFHDNRLFSKTKQKAFILFSHLAGPEDRVFYVANDTEIQSFVHPFNQSQGQKVLTHVEDNARIIGMDALFHHQKFVWATQFNPGGIFYKDILERGQTKAQTKNIVSNLKCRCSFWVIFVHSKPIFVRIFLPKKWILAVFRLPEAEGHLRWLDHGQYLLDRPLTNALVQLLHSTLDQAALFYQCGPTEGTKLHPPGYWHCRRTVRHRC